MKRGTTKSRRKGEKIDNIYLRLTKAYFYKAFESIHPSIVEQLVPEGTEPLPCDIFMLDGPGSAAQKALYHDPAPRTLSPVIHTLVAVHQHVVDAIAMNRPEFINQLLAIPPSKITILAQMAEPQGKVRGTFTEHVLARKSTINVDQAAMAMNLFIKALVEAMLACIVMIKHLPGDKNYPFRLCQVACMPRSIVQFVGSIPPPVSRKKGTAAAAPIAPAAPSAPAAAPVAPAASADDDEIADEVDVDNEEEGDDESQ